MKFIRLIGPAIAGLLVFGAAHKYGEHQYQKGLKFGEASAQRALNNFFATHTFRPKPAKIAFNYRDKGITKQLEWFDNSIRTIILNSFDQYMAEDIVVGHGIRIYYNGGEWITNEEAQKNTAFTDELQIRGQSGQ